MSHKEHKLGGVVEAALNTCAGDQKWLESMASDPEIAQNTDREVFRALISYIVDELALKTNNH